MLNGGTQIRLQPVLGWSAAKVWRCVWATLAVAGATGVSLPVLGRARSGVTTLMPLAHSLNVARDCSHAMEIGTWMAHGHKSAITSATWANIILTLTPHLTI